MRNVRIRHRIAAGAVAAMTLGGAFALGLPTGATAGAAGTVATTTTVSSNRAVATYTPSGAIIARVRSAVTGGGVPTGSVDFAIDGGYYETVGLDVYGVARMPLTDVFPAFYPGVYSVSATYSGDATHDPSTSNSVTQTLVGISAPPVTTLTSNLKGLPVFSIRSFTMQSLNPVGCNVTITNTTPNTVALAYGTPGNWKRLPFGTIAPGASKGVGVGIAPYTGYFTTTANLANYVAIHCR
jgi:hypothetical protein